MDGYRSLAERVFQIINLPFEMLLLIMLSIANNSFKDAVALQSTCKRLKEVFDSDEFRKNVNVDSLLDILWYIPNRKAFLMKFSVAGNLGVRTDIVLREFFEDVNKPGSLQIALASLEDLSNREYFRATFSCGVLASIMLGKDSEIAIRMLSICIRPKNAHLLGDCELFFNRDRTGWKKQFSHKLRNGMLCEQFKVRGHGFVWGVFYEDIHTLECKKCAMDHIVHNVKQQHHRTVLQFAVPPRGV